jgi:glycosyltransferase involved in cell wall biosynthesis
MSIDVPEKAPAAATNCPETISARTETTAVLHVINGEHYSGAERVQDLLAGRLPEFGFRVGLACVKPDRFPLMFQSREAPLYRMPMSGRLDLRAVRRLVAIVRAGGYQLLHAHTPRTVLVAALASKITGVPLVYHVHSPTLRDSTSPWRNRINAWIERISLARASALIAVSQSLGEYIRARAPRGAVVAVVPNGVPCRRPWPVRTEAHEPWTIGAVALFRPRKGMEILLDALAMLRSAGLPVRLRAVGDFETPDYRHEVLNRVERLGLKGAIDWTGFTQDVDAELDRMDTFVLPSLFGEGLPMVVLEAMAAGVPIVATRVEGTPEAIRDGQDGLIVPPGDAAALAAAIHRIFSGQTDREALRASAHERHAQHFSDQSMAAGGAEVYRRVLSAATSRSA